MSSILLGNPDVQKLVSPFTLEKYHMLYEHGLISEKTELLDGVVIEKIPKNPIHTAALNKIFLFLISITQKPFQVRKEDPITIFNSEPEPDISIVDYREDAYSIAHPAWAHLVIEIANTSLALDREKAHIYAEGKIPEYWIVNLNDLIVEVHRDPEGNDYKQKKIYSSTEEITSLFSSKVQFKLSDFL